MNVPGRHRAICWIIAGHYVLLAVAWSFVIPLKGPADEARHFRYLQIVAEERRLPGPAEKAEAISHHPPAYYISAAAVYLAARGLGESSTWHILRLWSVLLGGLTLWLIYRTLALVFPEQPAVVYYGTIYVGILPHYLLVCSGVSNDAAVTLFCTALLYLVALRITGHDSYKLALLAGLAAGLAVLTKHTALVLVVPAGIGLFAGAWLNREGRQPDGEASAGSERLLSAIRELLVYVGAFAFTAGIWLASYIGTWGRLDSDPPWPWYTWPHPGLWEKFIRAADGLYRSTWVQMGWLPGPHSSPPLQPSALYPRPNLETPVFVLLLPLVVLAICGTVICVWRWYRQSDSRSRAVVVGMLMASGVFMYAALTQNAMFVNPGRFEGGRYLLPAVAGYIPLLAIGPLAVPCRWRKPAWVATYVILLAMNAISFVEMYVYMIPSFAP